MITETILGTMLHELTVCQHLYTKIDATEANARPKSNMRSTLELLQYISTIAASQIKHYIANPPKEGAMERYLASRSTSKDMTFAEFPAAADREKEELKQLFSGIKDSDLTKMTYQPFNGNELNLFEALLFVTRVLAAYRHELFLRAKLSGAEVNTANNWAGMDMTPQQQQAVRAAAAAATSH